MSFAKTLKKIVIGPKAAKYNYVSPAIPNQWKNFQNAWNDEKEGTFGIERLLKLFLILIQFAFPVLYIRHYSGIRGLLYRKIAIEIYVITKTIAPIAYLYFGIERNPFILAAVIYSIFDTVFYLLGLMFLSDIYVSPISQKRSFLLLMLNYIEVTLCFSVLYKGLGVIKGIYCNIQAVYFSFVTSTTLGYGDYTPSNEIGQIIVVFQLLIMALFVFLFFSTVASRINEKNDSFKKKQINNRDVQRTLKKEKNTST